MSRKPSAGLLAVTMVALFTAVFAARGSSVPASPPDATAVDAGPEVVGIGKGQQRHLPVPLVAQAAHPVAGPELPAAVPQVAAAPSRFAFLDADGVRPRQRAIIEDALRHMPQPCIDAIRNFYVVYSDLPSRGQAGRSTIILSGMIDAPETDASADEFRALLLHEFGHVVSLSDCLPSRDLVGDSAFHDGPQPIAAGQRAVEFYEISWTDDHTVRLGTTDADFVSGYAASEPIEDFAETFAYALTQPEAFAARAAENPVLARKREWMLQHVLAAVPATAVSEATWTGRVPWDVTLLPYRWTGELPQRTAQTAPRLIP